MQPFIIPPHDHAGAMGRGKNKQTNSGLGAQPKETKEQRRQRLADEAQAREVLFTLFYVCIFSFCLSHLVLNAFFKLSTPTH